MRKKLEIIKLVFVILMTALVSMNFALTMFEYAKKPPVAYHYIGDEVWYVSAARNILREVFHTYPPCGSTCNATLQFKNMLSEFKFITNISKKYNVEILMNYTKVRFAIYVRAPKQFIMNLMNNMSAYNLTVVQPGWYYPQQPGILKYLNLEHPPLGKYFIAYAMLHKDVPWMWRVPGITLTAIAIFIMMTLIYWYSRSLMLWFAGLTLIYFDLPLRVMSMVAMLDIYAAVFSMIALALLPFSLWASTVVWALAVSSKYTAAFYVIPIAYVFWRKMGRGPLKALMKPTVVVIAMVVITSIPLIVTLGPLNWLIEVLKGLGWFTVSRPAGPPPASPWDWINGKVASPLYISPSIYVLTNSTIIKMGILSFFLLYPLRDKKRGYKVSWLAAFFLVSALVGFELLYLKGNRTLYTFYTVVFTPMADVAAAGILLLLTSFTDIGYAVNWWTSELKLVASWLWGAKKLKCELVDLAPREGSKGEETSEREEAIEPETEGNEQESQ